jgi:asparagine synthase (glutamine-hydrolysing)
VSGICGLFNLDGAPVSEQEIGAMAALLERRGPEGTGIWREGSAGLGHTLLATTPEALHERLPLRHPETGCTITADVRLDNRGELLGLLGLRERRDLGDAEILLLGYLRWGDRCVERFLGDFAFAIWDPRDRKLFCGRDQMGMRPFYYHHAPGRFFAFASEPEAILVLPQTPYRINEERIADYLVGGVLEGIDQTRTFYEEVFRLSPARALTVAATGLRDRAYWDPVPGDELKLRNTNEYVEAFRALLIEATASRLRTSGALGSMLSGGLDSSSVTAIASRWLADQRKGPLHTFSARSRHGDTCVETRSIQSALTLPGLAPHTVSPEELSDFEELGRLTREIAEPFDGHMTLIRLVYLLAQRAGVHVVLDGVSSDVLLAEGTYLARLLRRGRLLAAMREARSQSRYWDEDPTHRELARALKSASPHPMRQLYHALRPSRLEGRVADVIRRSRLHPDFAARTQLAQRLRSSRHFSSPAPLGSYTAERLAAILHPDLTVGRERYARLAAASSVEPRDPFLDLRLVSFAARLPGDQRLVDGAPKAILRRAMAGQLPNAIVTRRGRDHLGWSFTQRFVRDNRQDIEHRLRARADLLAPYVDGGVLAKLNEPDPLRTTTGVDEMMYHLVHLADWLHQHHTRPRALGADPSRRTRSEPQWEDT